MVKILVVDDEPRNIAIIADILEKYEYEIIAANNGLTAYEIAKKIHPEIILMDWDMPVMTGLESIQKLKSDSSTKDIPVIMISGIMTSSENLKTALDAGAIDYVRKPIDELELMARVRSILMLAFTNKEIIKMKNNELTTAILQLVQANEFYNLVVSKIEEIIGLPTRSDIMIKEDLFNLLSEIKSKNKIINWDLFNEQFLKVNPEFLHNLTQHHNSLTPAELKLCTLLILNLNTKEIASLLNQTVDSVRVSRTRLRKKLSLESKENLVNYLLKL